MHGPDEEWGQGKRKAAQACCLADTELKFNIRASCIYCQHQCKKIHLRSTIFQTSKTRIFKLRLEPGLISQGPTLISTAPVYTKDGLSQKTSQQYFVLWDNPGLVSSLGLQSLKSYIILQASYRPYIKHKVSQRCNTIHTSNDRHTMSTQTERETTACWTSQVLWPQDSRKSSTGLLIGREGSRDLWHVAELYFW